MDTGSTAPPKDTTNNSHNGLQLLCFTADEISKNGQYEGDFASHLRAKYSSNKDVHGGDINDLAVTVGNETIEAISMPKRINHDAQEGAYREDIPTGAILREEQASCNSHRSCRRVWIPSSWEPHQLVCCPEQHISHQQVVGRVDNFVRFHDFGSERLLAGLYERVIDDNETHTLWLSCGLSDFWRSVTGFASPHESGPTIVRTLLEYFWDTTNTFHFPWGEMTVTPLDFMMISGLHFRPKPLQQDVNIRLSSPLVLDLLGPIVEVLRGRQGNNRKGTKMISAASLAEGFDHPQATAEQRVRIFVLVFLSSILSPNRGSRVMLQYLPSLAVLADVGSYDWASLSYADLFMSLRQACRQVDDTPKVTVSGLWRIVELWFYEYFPTLAPIRATGVTSSFPIGASWRQRGASAITSMAALRGILQRVGCADSRFNVWYRPWDSMGGIEGYKYTFYLSNHRAIFLGTRFPTWYLGERVTKQHSTNYFVVPLDPPASMMCPHRIFAIIDGGGPSRTSWHKLVYIKRDYVTELLPRLALAPGFQKAPRHGKTFQIPSQSIRYQGLFGEVEEHLPDAPEGYRQAQASLPDDLEWVSRDELMKILKVIDALKYSLIKLRGHQMKCHCDLEDKQRPRHWSRSRPRHGESDGAGVSHRRSSPEFPRQPQLQPYHKILPPQPFQAVLLPPPSGPLSWMATPCNRPQIRLQTS